MELICMVDVNVFRSMPDALASTVVKKRLELRKIDLRP